MINLETLRMELHKCSVRSKIWKVVKDEVSRRGHWKMKPRGNPVKAKEASDAVKRCRFSRTDTHL